MVLAAMELRYTPRWVYAVLSERTSNEASNVPLLESTDWPNVEYLLCKQKLLSC